MVIDERGGPPADPHPPSESHGALALLALTALGVVYGDIGTSPLYALRQSFYGPHRVSVNEPNVLGILSLVFWTLTIVVTFKYLVYVIRADNRGEGGILALTALVRSQVSARTRWFVVTLGLFGAALLYGDGMITPAISVLGAIEGLEVAAPALTHWIVPITVVILVGMFAVQRFGTATVGAVFGPVMILWFATLSVLGIRGILMEPGVVVAVNPAYAVRFFALNGYDGFLVLGAVFLVATGGETLYADLGHFGARPIRLNWFMLVGPALLLNYFGQGALVLSNPDAAQNPFFRLAPEWGLYPLLFLATMAAIIASQAVISGAFSLTRQAVQLGYLPRMAIVHTSATKIGQIYIPAVNRALMIATIAIVIGFGSTTNLASAYGVAVTTTMVITTLLAFFVARRIWGWKLLVAGLVTGGFLLFDLTYFSANIIKVAQGGWLPLSVAAVILAVMTTWQKGRMLLMERSVTGLTVENLIEDIGRSSVARVPGAAIFLYADATQIPTALLHNLKHNKVLHSQNVFLTVENEEIPYVTDEERVDVQDLGGNFHRVVARYGFMEDPDVPWILQTAKERGLELARGMPTYMLSRNAVIPSREPTMARWRERLFIFLNSNALRPTQFFHIPPNQVVEIGRQVSL
ncbi:MAG TPA: potassium transporter Kup [Gemmatimonadota bacterium]|nr:potassium transporter Kup [Gemmatimonadota bacterium]